LSFSLAARDVQLTLRWRVNDVFAKHYFYTPRPFTHVAPLFYSSATRMHQIRLASQVTYELDVPERVPRLQVRHF
jgi:hypothetical protein